MAIGKFNPGDVVVLKSGSPEMTVDFSTDNGFTYCTYYDYRTNALHREIEFRTTSLKVHDPSSSAFVA